MYLNLSKLNIYSISYGSTGRPRPVSRNRPIRGLKPVRRPLRLASWMPSRFCLLRGGHSEPQKVIHKSDGGTRESEIVNVSKLG